MKVLKKPIVDLEVPCSSQGGGTKSPNRLDEIKQHTVYKSLTHSYHLDRQVRTPRNSQDKPIFTRTLNLAPFGMARYRFSQEPVP